MTPYLMEESGAGLHQGELASEIFRPLASFAGNSLPHFLNKILRQQV
jgi:hypothetical protein